MYIRVVLGLQWITSYKHTVSWKYSSQNYLDSDTSATQHTVEWRAFPLVAELPIAQQYNTL